MISLPLQNNFLLETKEYPQKLLKKTNSKKYKKRNAKYYVSTKEVKSEKTIGVGLKTWKEILQVNMFVRSILHRGRI